MNIARAYIRAMPSFVRILVFGLLAVFAASSAANASSMTTMAVQMQVADNYHMNMADCTDCNLSHNADKGGMACDFACTSSFVAILGPNYALSVPVAISTVSPKGAYKLVGRASLPDPFPPRAII